MLVLTRRIGESLKIGDDIEVKVLGAHGNQVKIGIAAPDDVSILRDELWECNRDDCEWVDARNKAVRSGEVCLTCNRI